MPQHQAKAPAEKKKRQKPVQQPPRSEQTSPQLDVNPPIAEEWLQAPKDPLLTSTALQRSMLESMRTLQGNRQTSRMVSTLQRHHGGQEDEETVQRAEITAEATRLATVSPAAAPLTLRAERSFFSDHVGELAAGDSVRILEESTFLARVHVERGDLRGRTGWTRKSGLSNTGETTSNRTPDAGPEDAYARLQSQLTSAAPSRREILTIIDFHLTQTQRQRLAQVGNPEYAQLLALGVITPVDFLSTCNLIGIRLHRKISDYLTKGGTDTEPLRQAFASSTDPERLEVARDDALVGRLRLVLSRVHPEIVLGTVIIELYPENGRLATLRADRPELAAWLRPFAGRRNLRQSAEARAEGLQNALTQMNTRGAARARSTVRSAIQAAPRGAALPGEERAALDQIEELAYANGSYTSADLGVMFLTRWGKPFVDAASRPKTFIHRLWNAFKPLPLDEILLNNIIRSITENTNPNALGSFNDFLTNPDEFGRLRYNRPVTEEVHADGAQRGRTIRVREPSLDLLTPGTQVAVTQAAGVVNTTVSGVNVGNKTVRLAASVNVIDNAPITPTSGPAGDLGTAQRITTRTAFLGDNAGAPNPGNVLGNIEPGNLFSQTNTANVGGVNYLGGTMNAGPFRNQFGWIAATSVVALGGTMEAENFNWTTRHEIGHSLDTQLNGFSRFSAPSAARWIKYPNVNDWVNNVIRDGGVVNPDTNVVHNAVNANFRQAATVYSQAVQAGNATAANALLARNWLRGWRNAPGGSLAVYNVVTQFDANGFYYTQGNRGLPPLGGRIYAAHYNEWYSASDAARNESIAAGVPTYAYTCNYEFFADHYAAYTGPGAGGQRYARAVPGWAQNFFDRLVGAEGAGPQVGMERQNMNS